MIINTTSATFVLGSNTMVTSRVCTLVNLPVGTQKTAQCKLQVKQNCQNRFYQNGCCYLCVILLCCCYLGKNWRAVSMYGRYQPITPETTLWDIEQREESATRRAPTALVNYIEQNLTKQTEQLWHNFVKGNFVILLKITHFSVKISRFEYE